MKKNFEWYKFDKVLSYNAVINCVIGARGVGKTYGAKRLAIKNAINKGEQFIYLRRYKSELKNAPNFFNDIAHEFPDWDLKVRGRTAIMRPKTAKKDDEWTLIGYFVPLSVSQANKSTAYPDVTTIIFDEFIIDKGNLLYLSNEVRVFLDFYNTVDRYQDKTRVLMLSNSASIMNPYFIDWNIIPDREIIKYGDGFVVVHTVDSSMYGAQVSKTRFGKFVTVHSKEYAQYAIENEFQDSTDDFVCKKTGVATHMFNLRTDDGKYSVWFDSGQWFVQKKIPKTPVTNLTLSKNMREGEIQATYSDKLMQTLRAAYRQGRMYFDDASTRNGIRKIFIR